MTLRRVWAVAAAAALLGVDPGRAQEPASGKARLAVASLGQRSITLRVEGRPPEGSRVLMAEHPRDGVLSRTVEEWRQDAAWGRVPVSGPSLPGRIRVDGLTPGTRYAVLLAPEGGEPERVLTTATLPGPGRTTYMTLPVLVVLYTPITYTDHPKGQPLPAGNDAHLTTADMARIRQGMGRVADFYWRNSGAALNLDFHYATLDRAFDEEGDVEAAFETDFEAAAASLNRKPEDYTGVIFLFGWDDALAPAAKEKVYRGAAFGGLTYGVDAPWKYKKTPHSWIHFTRHADIVWTVVHEYHHQLDSLFEASGYPEYYFNHPDPSSPHGRFGEHYDVNAWILRSWPRWKWMGLSHGRLDVATDTDGDGLPDDAPVPLDEASFGSDPGSADADGDGLGDLQEAMTFAGVTAGLDEAMGGPVVLPAPTRPDADGDGVEDGRDAYPLYAADYERPRGAPRWDAPLESGGWRPFAEVRNDEVEAESFLNWDEEALYFAVRSSRSVTLHLDLDAANDGWFHGSDNYRLTLRPRALAGDQPPVDAAIFDWDRFFATPQVYVYWNREKVKPEQVRFEEGMEGGRHVLKVAIPRNESTSLTPRVGKRLGVKPSLSWPGRPVERRLLTFFAPHELLELRLTDGK